MTVDDRQQDSSAGRSRVGYMLRMYPRFSQTFVVNEILGLERQGVKVHILSLRKPTDGRFHALLGEVRASCDYLPEMFLESPFKVLRAMQHALSSGSVRCWRALCRTVRYRGISWTDFWQAGLVLRWVRKNRIPHVHVHFGTNEASVAYLAHVMGGLSYSLTLHAFDIFRDNVDRRLLTRKINASRFTVTVSEYNRRHLIDTLPGVDSKRIRVSYNGIDLQRFRPRARGRSRREILAVGRLIEKKGFIDLVHAVGGLRDRGLAVRCRIVGEGPEKTHLREAIAQLKLKDQVELSGSLPHERIADLMAEAACLVLPCVRAADGNVDALPTVLLEAMAARCPCVSTRISGVPEIIEDGRSGLLVEPGDREALTGAIARILEEPELAERIAREGRERAERLFDLDQSVTRLKTWFTHADAGRAKVDGAASEKAVVPAG